MNVLFINCVCSNTGDAAILQAAAELIRHAWGQDAHIIVQDDHSSRVQRFYPDLEFCASCYWSLAYTEQQGWRANLQRRRRFWKFTAARWLQRVRMRWLANRLLTDTEQRYLDAFDWAHVVVATGGTYLVEHYDLSQRLFDMQTATCLSKPLILFTQSVGPFRNLANRKRLRKIFERCRVILLRDQRSRDHLQDLHISADLIRIAPDAVFALADDDLPARTVAHHPLAKGCPRIAVSVRRWDHFADISPEDGMRHYCDAFASLTRHLIEKHNAKVTFLSTCQGVAGYHDDSQFASSIAMMLPGDVRAQVEVDGNFHTTSELRGLLRDFDLVVSTRMHLAILALGVGTPVLPVAYEFKTAELFQALGYPVNPPTIEKLSANGLISAVEQFADVYSDAAQQINATVDILRQRAWHVADLLRELRPEIESRVGTPPSTSAVASAALETL